MPVGSEEKELERAYMASEITENEFNTAKSGVAWPKKLPRPAVT